MKEKQITMQDISVLGEVTERNPEMVDKEYWKFKYLDNLTKSDLLKMKRHELIEKHPLSGAQTLWTLSDKAEVLLHSDETLLTLEEDDASFCDDSFETLQRIYEADDEFSASDIDTMGGELVSLHEYGYVERVEKRSGSADTWTATEKVQRVVEAVAKVNQ